MSTVDLQTRTSLNSEICKHDFISECGYIMLYDKLIFGGRRREFIGLRDTIHHEGREVRGGVPGRNLSRVHEEALFSGLNTMAHLARLFIWSWATWPVAVPLTVGWALPHK